MNAVKYSKARVEIHPREGLKMEMYASPFVRGCIGVAVLPVAAGLFLLLATPFAQVVKG